MKSKICIRCRVRKPNTHKYFNKQNESTNQLAKTCIACTEEIKLFKAKADEKFYNDLKIKQADAEEKFKTFCALNNEKNIINFHRYRSRRKGLTDTLTVEQWKSCKAYFNNRCAYCNGAENLLMDHIIPVSKGGGTESSNVIIACNECNKHKANTDFTIWYRKQKFYSIEREQKIINYMTSCVSERGTL